MAGYWLSDEDWIASWNKLGSPQEFSKLHGIAIRNVYARRRSIESRLGINLDTFASTNPGYQKKIHQTPGHTRRAFSSSRQAIDSIRNASAP